MRESMYGNNNAEKWDLSKATLFFEEAIEMAYIYDKDKDVYKYDFIGEIAREKKTYKEIFSYLKNRFKELEELHKELISTIEANCFYNTKKNKINTAIGIVNLKSNYGWTDRTDLTTKSEKLEVSPIIIELGTGIKENEVT